LSSSRDEFASNDDARSIANLPLLICQTWIFIYTVQQLHSSTYT